MVASKALVLVIVALAVMGFSLTFASTNPSLQARTTSQRNLSPSSSVTGSLSPVPAMQNGSGSIGNLTRIKSASLSALNEHGGSSLTSNVSSKYLFMPNLNANRMYTMQNNTVTPLYTSAPAPMGIGDFGVRQTSHGLSAYNLSTSSFEGTVTLSGLQALYPLNTDPSYVSIQLNTVLNNVTLFGSSTYTLWTQNVLLYSSSTHVLMFEDNIWNFSNPTTFLSPNAVYSSTGNVIPDIEAHIAVGPSIQTNGAFTVHLYINSTIINNRNAVFFNYSIPQMHLSGTYDRVIFNSTYGTSPGFTTPQSNFLVSGSRSLEDGLLYDAELTLGGPGGRSTTNIMNINGTMSLDYLNASTSAYSAVPSAFNYGADTGETASGVSVYWTPDHVAHLSTGPGFLQGMWGINNNSGAISVSGKISPSNGFLFLNPGSVQNDYAAQWVPIQPSGSYSYMVSPGTYTAQVLASNYEPLSSITVSGSAGESIMQGSINLVKNVSYGGYTPLYAYSNSQLANISSSGNGTASSPYVLLPQANVPIMFGRLSLQEFPVFAGVFLYNTTAHVTTAGDQLVVIQNIGGIIPMPYNTMPLVFDHAQNVTVTGEQVYGSFGPFYQDFPTGEITFYNSSNDMVAGNAFVPFLYSLLPYTIGLSVMYSHNISMVGNQFLYNIVLTYESTTSVSSNTFTGDLLLGLLSEFVGEYGSTSTLTGNLFQGSGDELVLNSSQNMVGNTFTTYSAVPIPGLPASPSGLVLLNSTMTGYMETYNGSDVSGTNSVMSFMYSIFNTTFFLQVDSTTSILNSRMGGDVFLQGGGSSSITGSAINTSELLVGPGVINLLSDNMVSSTIFASEGTANLMHSYMVSGIVEIFDANFTMVHSSAEGFILEAFEGNVAIIGSDISNGNMPSLFDPAVQYPWLIDIEFSTGYFFGDTFSTIDYNAGLLNYTFANYAGNYNSLTVLQSNAVVTHSRFITSGGNQASNLIIYSGTNTINDNLFFSHDVSRVGNLYGNGSALIVYGGVNTFFHNRFISVHSPAPSAYMGYGIYANAVQTGHGQGAFDISFRW